jgi:PAS domain S-box-containing protein
MSWTRRGFLNRLPNKGYSPIRWLRFVRKHVINETKRDSAVASKDVTDRENAEEAIRQSQKQYHDLVNTIDGIVWEGDAETVRFTFVSQQAERILGYPVQRWIDEPDFWRDHIYPEDREWAVAFCVQATKEKKPHQFEYRMIAADGRLVWLRDIVTVIVENNLPAKLRGVMIDITPRKAAEEQSQQNLERIRALNEIGAATSSSLELDVILEALMRKIVLLLPYAAVLVWLNNEETGRLERSACLNIDREEWMSRELAGVPALVKSAVEGKTFIVAKNVQTDSRTLDREFYKREGVVSYLGVPLVVKEKVLGVLVLLTREEHDFSSDEIDFVSTLAGQTAMAIFNADLYRQTTIQASELSKANGAISDFTAMIAHDLRSPLISVIGVSEMMKDGLFGAVNEEQKKWLGRVMVNGHQLVEMIGDFLDVSKLESGRISLMLEEVDLEKLLSAALDSHQLLAQNKQIALQKDVNPSTRLIQADARRLEQVVNNLLGNALKFTPAGGEIQLGSTGDESNAKVWVRDTGIGIAADEIGYLFEKYKQTTSGKTSEQKGTGLGLVICKMIVEAHGGRIWVESTEGKGTTFAFTLPFRRSADIAAEP